MMWLGIVLSVCSLGTFLALMFVCSLIVGAGSDSPEQKLADDEEQALWCSPKGRR